MRLSRDMSRRTHAKLGIRLVECILAVNRVSNVRLERWYSKPDLSVYHSIESCIALLSKLRQWSRDLHAHSSSFRNV